MTIKRWLEATYAQQTPRLPRGLIKGLARLHRLLLISSRGHLGGSLLDRPILLLTTTGRPLSPNQSARLAPLVRSDQLESTALAPKVR